IFELLLLFFIQHCVDGIHIACESRNGKIGPAVAVRDVLQTAVFACGIVEANPAGEVSERLGACPVRIVLMPGYDSAVMGGLAKELIVPEAHWPTEQLRCRNR